jgi:hypothetical protein
VTENHFRFLGLQRLANDRGLDVRTTVLRVATDLFCQTRAHSPSDVARYTDLALALLETADAATRSAVAEKLARIPHAPERLLRCFLDDPTGEVFALALLAAGIKRAPAINLLLITALPEVRTSVARIFAAADVHDATSRRVARMIVAAIAGERRTAAAVFEPHMHPSGTPQRAVGARRRPFVQQHRRDIIAKK